MPADPTAPSKCGLNRIYAV
uniref:Uncharacterized protein n=1 Tax=Anguilla anguilla TaxID=7936 RepID=A0A0E9VFL1_ANGAN